MKEDLALLRRKFINGFKQLAVNFLSEKWLFTVFTQLVFMMLHMNIPHGNGGKMRTPQTVDGKIAHGSVEPSPDFSFILKFYALLPKRKYVSVAARRFISRFGDGSFHVGFCT